MMIMTAWPRKSVYVIWGLLSVCPLSSSIGASTGSERKRWPPHVEGSWLLWAPAWGFDEGTSKKTSLLQNAKQGTHILMRSCEHGKDPMRAYKEQVISWKAKRLLASRERLCFMALVRGILDCHLMRIWWFYEYTGEGEIYAASVI
jgi:hypothetical protein